MPPVVAPRAARVQPPAPTLAATPPSLVTTSTARPCPPPACALPHRSPPSPCAAVESVRAAPSTRAARSKDASWTWAHSRPGELQRVHAVHAVRPRATAPSLFLSVGVNRVNTRFTLSPLPHPVKHTSSMAPPLLLSLLHSKPAAAGSHLPSSSVLSPVASSSPTPPSPSVPFPRQAAAISPPSLFLLPH